MLKNIKQQLINIISIIAVIIVLIAFLIGMYFTARSINYQFAYVEYEKRVQETVREMVKPEALKE